MLERGLEMAISKQYVELMDGTITVHSKKGCGSVFYSRNSYGTCRPKTDT
ncbi:MAG: hypothetical protein ACLR8P_23440 [Clostridium fessum]